MGRRTTSTPADTGKAGAMGKRLEQALAESDEIEAAETDQTDRPLPSHVKMSRPNRARSKVLQVRLNPEEYDAIAEIAERRGLPVSTVARAQLLAMIDDEESGDGDVAAQLEDVQRRIAIVMSKIRRMGSGVKGSTGRVTSSLR